MSATATADRRKTGQSNANRSESNPTARRRLCLGFLLATVPLGLVWRLAPLHLPPFAFKYGGSALWAMAVYWLAAFVLFRWRISAVAGIAAAIATAAECLKLLFWPPLDRFRETLAGKLLLGRYFSFGAMAAYLLAIAGVALVDRSLIDALRRNREVRCATKDRGV